MAAETNVYIVDDDEAVRDSIAALLTSAGFRIISFSSGEEFLRAAPQLEPGCLISDVRMPKLDGIALLNRLRALKLDFPAILITGHGDIRTAVDAIKSGAADFIEKPFSDESLLDAVQRAKGAAHSADKNARFAAKRLSLLTSREREVLERLVAGMPNKIIAHDLAISTRTVEFYRTRVMTKMGAHSLSELVRLALAAGVIIKLEQ